MESSFSGSEYVLDNSFAVVERSGEDLFDFVGAIDFGPLFFTPRYHIGDASNGRDGLQVAVVGGKS